MTQLHELPLHTPALVREIQSPADNTEWRTRLEEIGFLPGEPVRLVARGAPGGDPLVVRIADSTFALRRAEAACIQVQMLNEEAAR
jgi:ferrous iron transport protein A